ncbi:MAG: FkbM family methyltransferase [Actinomycetota bacterium]|nr:FkbM family methyltransferase [Actinomycetota bacterium]
MALAQRYPAAQFVCVEPANESRAILEENLVRNRIRATVFGVAIVGRSGRYRLETGPHPGMNRVAADDAGEITGMTLPELLDAAGVQIVDFLKVDIEGAERELFESSLDWGLRVRTLIAELHDGMTAAEATALLRPAGFESMPLQRGLRHYGLVCYRQTRIGRTERATVGAYGDL